MAQPLTIDDSFHASKVSLRKSGGSLIVSIPSDLVRLNGLTEGDEVDVMRTVTGEIVLKTDKTPWKINPPSLDDLLAQCDFDAPFSEDEAALEQTRPVEGEI